MERIQVQEFAKMIAIEVGGDNLQLKDAVTNAVVNESAMYTSFPEVHVDWMKRYNAMQH